MLAPPATSISVLFPVMASWGMLSVVTLTPTMLGEVTIEVLMIDPEESVVETLTAPKITVSCSLMESVRMV